MTRTARSALAETAERLEAEARVRLVDAFGQGMESSNARAPGRITLVGEHVDYVGGKIACMAIDLHVAAATRPSSDSMWRVTSGSRMVERAEPAMRGDIGDRVFAACLAASEFSREADPTEIAIAADLPEGAGLSSSAAVVCATLVAQLRRTRTSVNLEELVGLATRAEREIAGIPCGDMDQWAVIGSRAKQVLIFDAYRDSSEFVPWPWPDLAMVVVDTGVSHDVGGAGYRTRRREAEAVLERLGVGSCQEIGDRWEEIREEPMRRRARHIATETRRVDQVVEALRQADGAALGSHISESHRSLDQDYEVSTPEANKMVDAAEELDGCLGARQVGGGFGGSVMSLCTVDNVATIRRAMVESTGRPGLEGSWIVHPGEGVGNALQQYEQVARRTVHEQSQ